MPREIRTQIDIDAAASRVWQVLVGFDDYPSWHPSMTVKGVPEAGTKLTVRFDVPGLPTLSMKPRVLRSRPEAEFAWLGTVGVPGIFDGEHIFELEPLGPKQTRFVQREVFTGVLAGPVHSRIGVATRSAFEAANKALRARAEADGGKTPAPPGAESDGENTAAPARAEAG